MDLVKSTKKFYDVKNDNTAASMTSQNMAKPHFRLALINELEDHGIIGEGSVVSRKLREGLDATKVYKDDLVIDYDARLRYIQEINKITGVYAPQKVEKRSLSLNVDMTEKELDERIQDLQEELES